MTFMSIDASTKSTGVAIFEDQELRYYSCLVAKQSAPLLERIIIIVDKLKEVLNQFPDVSIIYLEEVRPDDGKNVQTQRALMWLQAQIAMMLYKEQKDVDIKYVYPSEWRKRCGIKQGRGVKRDELKKADIQFVKDRYHIDVNDDEADAIAIGASTFLNEDNIPQLNWGK